MHTNFFFLQKLCPYVHRLFFGAEIVSCFSQDKDELIIETVLNHEVLYMRFSLKPQHNYWSFPDTFSRARNNSIDLFAELVGKKILEVSCVQNDRAVKIQLNDGHLLFLRLYGTQGNLILFHEDTFVRAFHRKFELDQQIVPSQSNKDYIISEEAYAEHSSNLALLLPTLGAELSQFLKENNPNNDFWIFLNLLNKISESHTFYIYKNDTHVELSLLENDVTSPLFSSTNPIEACNILFQTFISSFQLQKEKNDAINKLKDQVKKTEKYIQKQGERLYFLQHEARNEEMGHILMSFMHQIPPKSTEVELDDLYHSPQKIVIKLKKDLNAQQNAEYYYKKAKNEWKEVAQIKENIASREQKLSLLHSQISEIENMTQLKELRTITKPIQQKTKEKESSLEQLFKKVVFENYVILIGKNSVNNDLLTQKYAHKDDIWLHARNVSGSHVVIKTIPGHKTPKHVIERAAEIAAYHSKARTDSLSPVMYTFKKFVRKIKGAAPGSVTVDKEEVIMVVPKDY